MKFAVHLADLSYPGGPDALLPTLTSLAKVADQGGISRITMMDHYFQMEPLRRSGRADARGLHLARLPGRPDLDHRAGSARLRGHLPPPGTARQDRHDARRAQRGRAVLGLGAAWYDREHRGLGVPFPSTAERFERLEETLQIVPADVERRRRTVRGPALPAGRDDLRAGTGRAAADHDRRAGRAQDAAAGRPVRGRVQPVPGRPRDRPAQAGGARRPLRDRGT